MAEPHGGAVRRRGRLTVYLGAAPGVGKTFAMLGEAHRRAERGTDVVVGLVETHGRERTEKQLAGLEVVPRRHVEHRGTTLTELDTDAVLARRPEVVLVDELAHTTVPGSRHAKRADDVAELLAAGIDVVTTVNIQHLESLNDEVERITGVRQRETVPDDVVRAADSIQLIDMSPDALRRRMAHGNIYRADTIDASLTSYFRVGNLTALRELALLWLADRVDDQLDDYRRAHRISETWPAKERIVVAVTGGPESETLLRRGARLAQRSAGAELLAVHVIASDGLRSTDERSLEGVQRLVGDLGGTFHTVVGEDRAAAVVEFASGANATMVLVGVSRHGRLRRLLAGTTGDRIASLAGRIDVHLVTHDHVARRTVARPALSPLSPTRTVAGWVGAVVLPLLLAGVLHSFTDTDDLALATLALLACTVAVALVGGLLPAVLGAVIGFGALNYWFTAPTGTLTVAEPRNLLVLAVFVAVAVGVATVVDRASRRAAEALDARTEAATMSNLSQSVLTGQDTAEAVVERVRETFGQRAVSLLTRTEAGWVVVASAGGPCAASPEDGDTRVRVDDTHVLALCGEPLRAADQRVLNGFATQAGLVLEYRRLRERDLRAATLERTEATSTALLRAVSHDLRTPLATMRTSVDGALLDSVSPDERTELLAAVDASAETLQRLIDDLLDLSRLESGLVRPALRPLSLDEVLPLAVAGHPPDAVVLDVDESVPLVHTDAGLLTRVVANLVDNAVRHGGGQPVRVLAHVLPDAVEVLVVDRGPGVDEQQRTRMFEPFQRLGDTSSGGLGLGLAVARGLLDALGGTLAAEDTPGGGLTMIVGLPRAGEEHR
ncbi:ATP-binding protein [uncultured Nocardioides sp.]|uniref:ATP-binding protein n=1 Tax=uncultured Nocardioides sp. TaxID=198441 RepID=UPI0026326875|nr:ATP-binding protein [uncultured Nocardioides sp.]